MDHIELPIFFPLDKALVNKMQYSSIDFHRFLNWTPLDHGIAVSQRRAPAAISYALNGHIVKVIGSFAPPEYTEMLS